jgi:hypothetical protein
MWLQVCHKNWSLLIWGRTGGCDDAHNCRIFQALFRPSGRVPLKPLSWRSLHILYTSTENKFLSIHKNGEVNGLKVAPSRITNLINDNHGGSWRTYKIFSHISPSVSGIGSVRLGFPVNCLHTLVDTTCQNQLRDTVFIFNIITVLLISWNT